MLAKPPQVAAQLVIVEIMRMAQEGIVKYRPEQHAKGGGVLKKNVEEEQLIFG
jgi:hypothetical protein